MALNDDWFTIKSDIITRMRDIISHKKEILKPEVKWENVDHDDLLNS